MKRSVNGVTLDSFTNDIRMTTVTWFGLFSAALKVFKWGPGDVKLG